jgi:glycosyltransferase involved in cell wall biosynthesis
LDKTCCHINLFPGFGGSEVYTRFFCKAFAELGWKVVLFVNPKADCWGRLDMHGARLAPVANPDEILAQLPAERALVIDHSPGNQALAGRIRARHLSVCVVYQPVYERDPEQYRPYHVLWSISRHINASLVHAGLGPFHAEPLYGPGEADRLAASHGGPLTAKTPYAWDERKMRDRLLGLVHPWLARLAPPLSYRRRQGLTLGIVSRIAGIKKFPELFAILSPVIAKFPAVWLEVFGQGGYASVRDLKASIAPIRDRVRFWGHQEDVARVYPLIDYLMTGIPEREGLGLNVIEAWYHGTPVLAPNAPPFDETVFPGKTGFLYTDPRKDQGADFERLLKELVAAPARLDPLQATECRREFSYPRFLERVRTALAQLPEPFAVAA